MMSKPAMLRTKEFDRTVQRLIHEVGNARGTYAAITAIAGKSSSNLFLQTAAASLQSDLLIRLIRVLERDQRVSSFWYLHHVDPVRVSQGIDVKRLKKFAEKLRKIRDKVFVHIDRDTVFDPQRAYREAGIKGVEIREAIGGLWLVLSRLFKEQTGFDCQGANTRLDDLITDFRCDFMKLDG